MRLFVMIEPSTNQQSLDVLIQALKNADTVDTINTMEFIKKTEKLIVKSFFMSSQCNKIE
ncbi:hypothetical protein N3Z17_04485 [Candidatus Bandiella numerosa]|uniref:hypothetical protein n=1 Tax=Candidatus Bandiella numerosa TaxID=2570586 RepID=UPI00249E7335|nr:hypothetical protein [Candidatus Bandiella numerosa]WHA04484.1 hypothetical protein N3Z17_04485 [Candidatus Bandiella numerosa]